MARPDPKRLDALLAIGALLAPRAKKLSAMVTQAFREPAAYIARHASRMDERGIDRPTASLPWLALIDALERAKALFELDWKATDEDVDWAVRKLAKGFRLPSGDEERSTWEALEEAGLALREKMLQLAQLDYGSDSYALVAVPTAKLTQLVRLAKQARYGAVESFGDELAAARKDRVKRANQRARELAKPVPKEPAWRWFARGKELWTIQGWPSAVRLGYDAPGVKRHFEHAFAAKGAGSAFARRLVAEWARDGFRELGKAEQDAWPRQGDGAYMGVVFPFPEAADARYFRGTETVECLYVEGNALVETSGTIGRSFGELEKWHHGPDPAAVLAKRLAELSLWKPIDRAQLEKLYARRKKR
jgi:hypothetical protein